jgi:prepilin-type N-terminal cleavage/methylation domain-containing protein
MTAAGNTIAKRRSQKRFGGRTVLGAQHGDGGFTLLEMMVSMGIFLLICGSAFTLLGVSQRRYQSESQVLNSFQEARLGLDQMVRDISDAGYPPPNQFEFPPNTTNGPNYSQYADTPVTWNPNYTSSPQVPCWIGNTCNTPGPYGLFLEVTPQVPGLVSFIRYTIMDGTTTLGRGVFPKPTSIVDPYATYPDSLLVPFVQNVMNYASPAQIAQINAVYPNMFPGGNPVPMFTYTCATPTGPQDCSTAGLPYGTPMNIRSITITLIVQTPTPDPQTGQRRVVELTGRASVMNSFP